MKQKEKRTNKSTKPKPKDAYDLPNLHTNVLMKYLNSAWRNSMYYPSNDPNCVGIPLDAIKEELAKREHVNNKIEARAERQAAARGKK